jgi:hypothetical protein
MNVNVSFLYEEGESKYLEGMGLRPKKTPAVPTPIWADQPERPPDISKETTTFPVSFTIQMEEEESPKITIQIPVDPELAKKILAPEMEDLYLLYGTPGLNGLHAGMDMMPEDASEMASYHAMLAPIFDDCLGDIRTRAKKACEDVEAIAANLAIGKIAESRKEILAETARYFVDQTPDNALELLQGGMTTWGLKAYFQGDGEALIHTMDQLRMEQNGWKAAAQQYNDKLDTLVDIGNPFAIAVKKDMRNTGSLNPSHPEMAEAEQACAEALTTYLDHQYMACLRYPVLYRFLGTSNLPTYSSDPQSYIKVSGVQGGKMEAFVKELLLTLRDAESASRTLMADILGDPGNVWRYPSLISEAVCSMKVGSADFLGRAVSEKISSTKGILDWANNFSNVMGMIPARLSGGPPPLPPVFYWIIAIIFAGSIVGQFYDAYMKNVAFRAFLDPAKSIAGEESYLFLFVINILMLLGAKAIPKKIMDTVMLLQGAYSAKDLIKPLGEYW